MIHLGGLECVRACVYVGVWGVRGGHCKTLL